MPPEAAAAPQQSRLTAIDAGIAAAFSLAIPDDQGEGSQSTP